MARPPANMEFRLTELQQKWLEKYKERFPESMVYDLCQNPNVFGRTADAANHLPTITRNAGRFFNVARGRWLLPSERLLANGLPVAPWAAALAGAVCRGHLLADFGVTAQSSFTGNAMHLTSVQSALAFVLAFASRTCGTGAAGAGVGAAALAGQPRAARAEDTGGGRHGRPAASTEATAA